MFKGLRVGYGLPFFVGMILLTAINIMNTATQNNPVAFAALVRSMRAGTTILKDDLIQQYRGKTKNSKNLQRLLMLDFHSIAVNEAGELEIL